MVHEMVLEKEGAPIYKAYFGGPIIEKQSLNGISMGWLVNWKDFVAEHYLGDYMNQYSWPEFFHAELDEISYALYEDEDAV